MNVLLTLRQPLLPADTGGKVRSFNIFSRLAKRVSLHAVSFADPDREQTAIEEMKSIFSSYTPIAWKEAEKHSAPFYAQIMANQFGPWPYFLSKCNRPEFRSTVMALLGRHKFDVLFCDFLHTAAPLLGSWKGPRVVFEHNVEFLLRKRRWETETNLLRRWVCKNEWRRTKRIEEAVCREFDSVLAVSEDDRATLQREFRTKNLSVIPAAVDTTYFQDTGQPPEPGRLVFVGSMDWDPNEHGVSWFVEQIYPLIKKSVRAAKLSIVGRNPSEHTRNFAARDSSIEVTGRVADVRPYISRAEVVVVPLRIGGGTRIKIPEAMAMAKPIVSTTIGAEGLPFKNGREICLADDPRDFASTVIELLDNPERRRSIGTAARSIVVHEHGWDRVVDRVQEVLERTVETPMLESRSSKAAFAQACA